MIENPALPFTFSEPITTERLTLRPMQTGDVDDVFAYWNLEEVMRYQLHGPRTLEETATEVETYSQALTLEGDRDYWQLGIILEQENGVTRLIGDIYFTIVSVKYSRGEIGWTLHPDFQGHGYATEAAGAIIDLAFRTLRLHRVIAELDPANSASIALCKRLGMREEAYFVKDMVVRGAWGDTGLYAVLAEEWLATH